MPLTVQGLQLFRQDPLDPFHIFLPPRAVKCQGPTVHFLAASLHPALAISVHVQLTLQSESNLHAVGHAKEWWCLNTGNTVFLTATSWRVGGRKGKAAWMTAIQAFLFLLTHQGPYPRPVFGKQTQPEEQWKAPLHGQPCLGAPPLDSCSKCWQGWGGGGGVHTAGLKAWCDC